MNTKVFFYSPGKIDYNECWNFQEKLFNQLISDKSANDKERINHLIFCQHPHVYTLGKSGDEHNLLINMIELQTKQATFVKTNRGGDITYHGPGQLVGYPIFDLELFTIGLKEYIHLLEEVIIQTLAEYGILGLRLQGATGVWLDIDKPGRTRKICAIGVRSSHWVTMHGFALNINTDLKYFDYINPCGYKDKSVTSMEKELGTQQNVEQVCQHVKNKMQKIFNFEWQMVSNQ